jgi:hypothetical protein
VRLRAGALALVATLAAPASAAPAPALPYGVAVDVTWGIPRGPESLRLDIERQLLRSLDDARCFERVQPLGTPEAEGDLVLRAVLDDYREDREFDVALVDRQRSVQDTGADALATVRLSAQVHLDVRLAGASAAATVRRDGFHLSLARRSMRGEDPRLAAADEFVDGVVRRAQRLLCKGSAERWGREIEAARAAVR